MGLVRNTGWAGLTGKSVSCVSSEFVLRHLRHQPSETKDNSLFLEFLDEPISSKVLPLTSQISATGSSPD